MSGEDWFGRLPNGVGTVRIEMTLELMLHVRLRSPEHFDAMVAAARELVAQNADWHVGLDEHVWAGLSESERGEKHAARERHGRYDDLLFVLSEYGAVEPTSFEQRHWQERYDAQAETRELGEASRVLDRRANLRLVDEP